VERQKLATGLLFEPSAQSTQLGDVMNFSVPTKCTLETVNAALVAAGGDDVDIFYDPYNSHYVTVGYRRYDEYDNPYYSNQPTCYKTAKQWALAVAEGKLELS
jgi:hypothetical protein